MVRGKKMNLGEFLGDQMAETALPSAPRVRNPDEEYDGGYRGRRGDRDGGYDRRGAGDASEQWRGDRGGDRFGDRGDRGDRYGDRGDRFGDRGGDRGGDRFARRADESDGVDNWRSGGRRGDDAGPSRYDRPPRGEFREREPEERPARMRLNLQRRSEEPGEGGASSSSGGSSIFGGARPVDTDSKTWGRDPEPRDQPPREPREARDQPPREQENEPEDKWARAFGGRSSGGGSFRRGGERDSDSGRGGRFGDRGDRDFRGGDRYGDRSDRFGDRGDRFGDRSGSSRGGDRFGDRGDRFGDRGDRFGDRGDRFGDRGDRFGDRGDRFGDRGDRFGDRGDRFGDRSRGFGRRDDYRDEREENTREAFGNMRVEDERAESSPQDRSPQRAASPQATAAASASPVKSTSPDQKRPLTKKEERRLKAEQERLAAEEAKAKAEEEKKRKEEEAKAKEKVSRDLLAPLLESGKLGEDLAQAGAKALKEANIKVAGKVLFEMVLEKAEDVAKSSANWIAPDAYGPFLRVMTENTDKISQKDALVALELFMAKHKFPKEILKKCFMALYSYDVIEEAGFFEYKYQTDRTIHINALVQVSDWLTWLETPEEESEEEEED